MIAEGVSVDDFVRYREKAAAAAALREGGGGGKRRQQQKRRRTPFFRFMLSVRDKLRQDGDFRADDSDALRLFSGSLWDQLTPDQKLCFKENGLIDEESRSPPPPPARKSDSPESAFEVIERPDMSGDAVVSSVDKTSSFSVSEQARTRSKDQTIAAEKLDVNTTAVLKPVTTSSPSPPETRLSLPLVAVAGATSKEKKREGGDEKHQPMARGETGGRDEKREEGEDCDDEVGSSASSTSSYEVGGAQSEPALPARRSLRGAFSVPKSLAIRAKPRAPLRRPRLLSTESTTTPAPPSSTNQDEEEEEEEIAAADVSGAEAAAAATVSADTAPTDCVVDGGGDHVRLPSSSSSVVSVAIRTPEALAAPPALKVIEEDLSNYVLVEKSRWLEIKRLIAMLHGNLLTP